MEERDSAVRTQLHQSQSTLTASLAQKLDERSTRDVVAQMLSTFQAHFMPVAAHSAHPPTPPTVTLLDVNGPLSPQHAASPPHAALAAPNDMPSSPSMWPVRPPSPAMLGSHSPPPPAVNSDAGSAEARAVVQRVDAMERLVSALQAELEHQSSAQDQSHAVAELTRRVQELRQELAQTSTARDVRQVANALKELSRQLLSASPSDGVTTVAAAANQMVLGSRVGELWRCLSCDQAPRSVSALEGVPLTAPGLRGAQHPLHHRRQRSGSPPPRTSSRSASPLREVCGRYPTHSRNLVDRHTFDLHRWCAMTIPTSPKHRIGHVRSNPLSNRLADANARIRPPRPLALKLH